MWEDIWSIVDAVRHVSQGTYLTFYTKHVTSGSHDVFMTGLRGWRGMEVKLQANARPQNNFQAVFVATKSDLVDGNLEHLQACLWQPKQVC